jgi:hypothetical protein
MSREPGIIDANILVYAMAVDAPQYASSRALLDSARDDPATAFGPRGAKGPRGQFWLSL